MSSRYIKRCRHFTGLQHKTCLAGVVYDSLRVDGALRGLPCLGERDGCAQYSAHTSEEIEEQEKAFRESTGRIRRARAAIVEACKTGPDAGVIDCPNCGGKLSYSRAQVNGHIYGHCRTKGCCSWME
jgi:hypothetical protein